MRESHSEGWLEGGEFQDAVCRFFGEPGRSAAPCWETADAAAGRFLTKLRQITADLTPGATLVVCSGGRVLTAVLHELGIVPSDEMVAMWRRIQMPDIAELAWRDGEVLLESAFGSRPFSWD